MSDLFWPGDERAGELMSDVALLAAIERVESAWLAALVDLGIAGLPGIAESADSPSTADSPDSAGGVGRTGRVGSPAEGIRTDLTGLLGADDVAELSAAAERGGNPVIPALALLRARLADVDPAAAHWLHRGLTSQDVLDTGLVLMLAEVGSRLQDELAEQIRLLAALAGRHARTPMAGRTLTQHAVPITFGLKAAQWLTAVLDAADQLAGVLNGLPGQFGGAAGTLAAACELAGGGGLDDPPRQAEHLVANACRRLSLRATPPWHTARAPFTRLADALVGCTDAWGRLALDVTTLSRPEFGELREGAAPGTGGERRGGSSTMPQKQNPILAVLVRRAALVAPSFGAVLHLAAAEAGDERPAGAWHTEWATLRTLARHCLVAGSQTTELLGGLQVGAGRMRATLDAAMPGIVAERAAMAALFDVTSSSGPGPAGDLDPDPTSYLGAADRLVDAVLARAEGYLLEHQ